MREILSKNEKSFLEIVNTGVGFTLHQISERSFGESEVKLRLDQKTAKALAEFIIKNLAKL